MYIYVKYICTYIHTYMHIYKYIHAYIHIHIHVYIHIHTYIYTYTPHHPHQQRPLRFQTPPCARAASFRATPSRQYLPPPTGRYSQKSAPQSLYLAILDSAIAFENLNLRAFALLVCSLHTFAAKAIHQRLSCLILRQFHHTAFDCVTA